MIFDYDRGLKLNKMKNYDSISADLWGYCDDYIKDCATQTIKNPNQNIYGLCCDYLLGEVTPKQRERLVNFFLNERKLNY